MMNSKENIKNYYLELGVQPDASDDEIHDAFRKLAKKYHPDRNKGDKQAEAKFKKINEAYRTLSDKSKRIIYHQKEEIRQKAKKASKGDDTSSFSEIFKKVFRSGFKDSPTGSQGIPRRGSDISIDLPLTVFEMEEGVDKKIKVNQSKKCKVCSGNGISPGGLNSQCNICNGMGEVPYFINGVTNFKTCDNCKGKGFIIRDRCLVCGGKGHLNSVVTLSVKIPSNSKPEDIIRIKSAGDEGINGGKQGDLLIKVGLKESDGIRKEGNDLYLDYPISIPEYLLGGEFIVKLNNKKTKFKLGKGTKHNQKVRFPKKGIKNKKGERGDFFVIIKHHLPSEIDAKTKKIIEDLKDKKDWQPER